MPNPPPLATRCKSAIDAIIAPHLAWSVGREDHSRLIMAAAGAAPLLARAGVMTGMRVDAFLSWVGQVGADQLGIKPGKAIPTAMVQSWQIGWRAAGVELQILHAALEMMGDDPVEVVALTENEAALVELLTREGQTGSKLAQALARKGFSGLGENEISRMSNRPHVHARGVRHRRGAGYYNVNA